VGRWGRLCGGGCCERESQRLRSATLKPSRAKEVSLSRAALGNECVYLGMYMYLWSASRL
jgi:hypothetical protein